MKKRKIYKDWNFYTFCRRRKEAEQLGASYLTAGHIYATDCKRGLPPRGLGFLKEVCREVSIPVYGIGGIKFDEEQWNDMKNVEQLVDVLCPE